jgi:erythromycin esterase-like protein
MQVNQQDTQMMKTKQALAWMLLIPTIAISGMASIAVYFVSAILTNLLVVNLSLSALTFLLVCYSLMRFLVSQLGFERPQVLAWAVSGIATVILVTLVAWPMLSVRFQSYPDNLSKRMLDGLRGNTFPLDTVRAGNSFDDLQPLQAILKEKRIVALGEATHGTSEFFRMKHRLLEFLVREMGFQHFGMELSPADGQLINAYITGEVPDLPQVLYWPWATAEVREMLDWMRAYNADPTLPHPLTFHGIDPIVGQRDAEMAENVAEILAKAGPESKIVLWAHNGHIANAPGRLGQALKHSWGEQAYLLGFEFNYGTFTSRMGTIHVYRVEAASPAYYAYALGQLDAPILLLDFRTMSQDPELKAWLAQPQRSHDMQELHAIYRLNPAWHTVQTSWLQLYDGIIYIEESTPAHSLP